MVYYSYCYCFWFIYERLMGPAKDYVYFQKTPFSIGDTIVESQVWPRAAGSDHRAVSGDVVLRS